MYVLQYFAFQCLCRRTEADGIYSKDVQKNVVTKVELSGLSLVRQLFTNGEGWQFYETISRNLLRPECNLATGDIAS